MITIDGDEMSSFTLGDPDPAKAGAGRIAAIDQCIIDWLERRRAVLERRARLLGSRPAITYRLERQAASDGEVTSLVGMIDPDEC